MSLYSVYIYTLSSEECPLVHMIPKDRSSEHAESFHRISEREAIHCHSCDEVSLWSLADSGTLTKNCGNIDLNPSR